MTDRVNVRKIGNSLGVIIPKGELERMHVKESEELYLVRTENGIELTPCDPEFSEAMEAGRKYMDKHRDALRELAK